jgi:hypothetical protein
LVSYEGDLGREIAFAALGVDGMFTDFDVAVAVLKRK